MSELKTIPIKDIHPDPNQPRKFYDETAMQELVSSVKDKGVLQPILIRPNGNGYKLVCGERRYRAAKAAGLSEIPTVIRNLSDDEALELQIIENLQRKDVHPMEEAVAFKSMLENKSKPYTIKDIAAKVNKPEAYISQRISLNALIPELQKEFWSGKFLTGHAVLFSRLSAEDQKVCMKECKSYWDDKQYKSVKEVQDFISRNIMRVLSAAPFKKDDPSLNPAMGACTNCPFRSGNNPSLFADIQETDRCFKPACFNTKIENWTIRKVESLLVEEPEVKLLANGHNKILTAIVNKAKEFNVKILKDYDDFHTWNAGGMKAKGIWVNGSELGQIVTVYLGRMGKNASAAASGSGSGKPVPTAIDDEIAGIRQRTKRAAELDDEKIWRRIHDEVLKDKALINSDTLSKVDTAAVLYAMYDKAGFGANDKIAKVFGGGDRKMLAKKMLDATPKQFNEAVRIFSLTALDAAVSSHTSNPGQGLLKMVAEQYHKEKIAAFELEQKEKRIKREERAQQRIKGLREQKKQLKVPSKKPSTDKPASKKAAKKGGKK
ncbi:MAG: ParB/RepB/Spo0J family partition protein [Flavisolibacter sp.]|jgi:ParB/RepB/Spo0J family partition protein